MMLSRHPRRGRLIAGVLGVAAALLAVASFGPLAVFPTLAATDDDGPGDISGPCDEAEHLDDPRCSRIQTQDRTSTTTTRPTTTRPTTGPPAPPDSGTEVLDAGAGTVTYAVSDGSLTLVETRPASGWSVEVEQGAGSELEVDFRSGAQRVQVNVELEDGHVRERARFRDGATGAETRVEDGEVVRTEPGGDHGDDDRRVESSGSGSVDSGRDDDHGYDDDDGGHRSRNRNRNRGGDDDRSEDDDHGEDD